MTRPFFSRNRISHFDNFDRHAEDAIRQLKNRLHEGHPVNFQVHFFLPLKNNSQNWISLQDLAARFTLDSATEFLFGNDVGSLSGGLPYPYYVKTGKTSSPSEDHPCSRFVAAFTEAQNILAFRMRFGMHWPLAEFWEDKLKKPLSIVHDFINPIVARAIKRKRDAEEDSTGLEKDRDDETLLENLVNSTEDPITLRDEIMSLLVAGRDTVRWGLMVKRGAIHRAIVMIDCEHVNVYRIHACRAPRGTMPPASGNFGEDRTTEEAYLWRF